MAYQSIWGLFDVQQQMTYGLKSVLRLLQAASGQPDIPQHEEEQEEPFGEDAHKAMMKYLWTVVIDFAIFFALYKYRRYSIYVHMAIGLFVALTTLIVSLPILIEEGIPDEENEQKQQQHFIIGIIIIIFIFAQVLIGTISKILQFIPWSSSTFIYLLNVAHKYMGYGFMILAKIQVFLFLDNKQDERSVFWGFITGEIAFFLLWIFRKLLFPTLSNINVPPSYQAKQLKLVPSVASINGTHEMIGVFANYIYNMQPLLRYHPIGYQIVNSIKTRDFDRYLYGMYTSQRVPIVPENSHGFKTMELLGDPIAKINIPSLYTNLNNDIDRQIDIFHKSYDCGSSLGCQTRSFSGELIFQPLELNNDINPISLDSIREVSSKGSIYEVRVVHNGAPFAYIGYSAINQLGRYYALTNNKCTTRLYTSVGFLDPQNIQFMEKYYFRPRNIPLNLNALKLVKNNPIEQQQTGESERRLYYSYLPLLIKMYPSGNMTRKLIYGDSSKLQLSSLRGQGLRLAETAPGKLIVVAGGTGLFPFSDLINLLFKSNLIASNPVLKAEAATLDPILNQNPFDKWTFQFFIAVNHIEDIHPITLAQLIELSLNQKQTTVSLRVKDKAGTSILQSSKIVSIDQNFDVLVRNELKSAYSKIYVCGPPIMNEAMIRLFDQVKLDDSKYLML